MISKEDIEKIRKAVDMVDYLSFRGVEAHQSGVSWKALCPVHSERSPSFHIKPEQNTFHCFGCGIGGDIFSLVQEMDSLSFYGAIQELADYAEIEITEEEDEEFKKTKRLYQLTELASKWFRENFELLPDEHPAKTNFSERNLLELANEDTTIGFAPNNGMKQYLGSKGYSTAEMKEVGLVSQGESEGPLFRKRIVWSIKNIQGKVVGFTARKIYDADIGGKYINSPQTKLYNKSHTLFGLFEAHKSITKHQAVYVVEGQTDVMALRAIGIDNVVAPNGTAFGKEHSLILQRLADRGKESKQFVINFCFDGDFAGVNAAKKVFEVDSSLQTSANVISIPKGDPCDVRMQEGDEALTNILETNKVSLLEFILKKELEEWDVRTPEGQAKFIGQASKLLAGVDNNVVLESYKRKISWWTGVPLSSLNISNGGSYQKRVTQNHVSVSASELRKRVIASLLQYPMETYEAILLQGLQADMFQKESKVIYERAIDVLKTQLFADETPSLRPEHFSNPKIISELLFLDLTQGAELNEARIKSITANICKVFLTDYINSENNMIQSRILAASDDHNLVEDEDLLGEILEARANMPVTRRRIGKKYTKRATPTENHVE